MCNRKRMCSFDGPAGGRNTPFIILSKNIFFATELNRGDIKKCSFTLSGA
jgi:hypothetical protein